MMNPMLPGIIPITPVFADGRVLDVLLLLPVASLLVVLVMMLWAFWNEFQEGKRLYGAAPLRMVRGPLRLVPHGKRAAPARRVRVQRRFATNGR